MIGALPLGIVTTAWSTWVVPAAALSPRAAAVVNASFAGGLVVLVRDCGASRLGLTSWRSGVKWGAAASVLPVLGAVAVARTPALLQRVRPANDNPADWIFFRIPVGTVVTEELVFRSVFDALAPRVSPIFFGLWHIHPARAAGDSVVGTVLGTVFAGAVFSWLRARSGSVLAPALLHLSVNVSGAVLAVMAQKKT